MLIPFPITFWLQKRIRSQVVAESMSFVDSGLLARTENVYETNYIVGGTDAISVSDAFSLYGRIDTRPPTANPPRITAVDNNNTCIGGRARYSLAVYFAAGGDTANSYQLQRSTVPDFSSIANVWTLANGTSQFNVTVPSDGDNYFRVCYVDGSGNRLGPWSEMYGLWVDNPCMV
jgi:hypothetical protein